MYQESLLEQSTFSIIEFALFSITACLCTCCWFKNSSNISKISLDKYTIHSFLNSIASQDIHTTTWAVIFVLFSVDYCCFQWILWHYIMFSNAANIVHISTHYHFSKFDGFLEIKQSLAQHLQNPSSYKGWAKFSTTHMLSTLLHV